MAFAKLLTLCRGVRDLEGSYIQKFRPTTVARCSQLVVHKYIPLPLQLNSLDLLYQRPIGLQCHIEPRTAQ